MTSSIRDTLRLPRDLHSSYTSQKAMENAIFDWLSRAADWYADHPPVIHNEGSSARTFSTKDLVAMAERIRTTTKVWVPPAIIEQLRSVIRSRQRCATWYGSRTTTDEELDADERHLYFLDTLQQVLNILLSASGPPPKPLNADTVVYKQPYVEDENEEEPPPEAAFSNIQLDTDVEMRQNIEEGLIGDTVNIEPVAYEVEGVSMTEDLLFRCCCVLEDLNALRKIIKGLWTQYHHGEMHLINAAVTTNVALQIARHFVDELMEAEHLKNDLYETIFVDFLFHTVACASRKVSFKEENLVGDSKGRRWDSTVMADVTEYVFLVVWMCLSYAPRLDSETRFHKEDKSWTFPFPTTFTSACSDGQPPQLKLAGDYFTLITARASEFWKPPFQ